MEKQNVIDCLKEITSALVILEDAKADTDAKVKGAISAYGFSKDQGRVLVKAAQAKIKSELDKVQKQADDLTAIIEIARERDFEMA